MFRSIHGKLRKAETTIEVQLPALRLEGKTAYGFFTGQGGCGDSFNGQQSHTVTCPHQFLLKIFTFSEKMQI